MKAEVVTSSMGVFVWIVEPLLYLGAFYFIFEALNLRGGGEAIPFLIIGLVVWKWFASSVQRGSDSIKSAASIMQQIHVPKYVFFLSTILSVLYQFVVFFLVLIIFLILYGIEPNMVWFYLVIVVTLQFLLIIGVAGLAAAILPFLPDLKIVISNGLTLVFFMSGVFFDISLVPDAYQKILHLNPMAIIIESYRDILLKGVVSNWEGLIVVAVFSLFLIVITSLLLKRWDKEYPKVLSV
ncbi:ABC transporter permease [uncultured Cycloclasticus sp.]|uniref:ABC transporter permease n=1 Tax=uncultured Cycloclasticus sp. TaxID=172194 RepID=UPI00258257A9|nr:ABC transporter permease [uncultured Cycloclasticus sp.]